MKRIVFLFFLLFFGFSTGVENVPPKILEISSTSPFVGGEALISATVFDGNGGFDVCTKSLCNVSCSFAEIFLSEKEQLSCNGSCTVFSQFVSDDFSPEWDPKKSHLVAKLSFGKEAKIGKWSCVISVSDKGGLSDEINYSLYLKKPSFFSVYRFSLIISFITFLVFSFQVLRLTIKNFSKVNWLEEKEKFIEAKAYLNKLEELLKHETNLKVSNRCYVILSEAKRFFFMGDYSEVLWLVRSAFSELDFNGRVRKPDRFLSWWEKIELFVVVFRRFFLRKFYN